MKMRRWALGALVGVMSLAGTAGTAVAGPNDVPTPNVTAVTGPGTAFLAADPAQLAEYGYVEQEYYVSGDAYGYSGTAGLTTGTRGSTAFPFRTRIVVRRPADPTKFNGTTVVEWNNVTAGFDVEWNWFNDPGYMMRKGYAWVGVSAQNAGVTYLRNWNPARYGATSPGGGLVVNGLAGDGLSYDIFGSVAKAVKGAFTGSDPMNGLTTTRVIASGESQSGGRLNIYYNAIQPLHELVDSFLITVAGGVLRSDRPEKAIRVLSERENGSPPTDPDGTNYRRWDVAGASHLPYMAYLNFAPIAGRDVGTAGLRADCQLRPLSRVPWPYVYNRALEAINAWQRGGAAPANGPKFTYAGSAIARDPQPAELVDGARPLSANGLAQGAIRLPELTLPTATNTGVNALAPPPPNLQPSPFSGFCSLLGSWMQYPTDLVNQLRGDYGTYVDQYKEASKEVFKQGFVTEDDVDRMAARATWYTRLRPTAPVLTIGSAATNAGAFGLEWRGPAPSEPATGTTTQYRLERRSSAPGAGWGPVPGAEALSARSLDQSDATEGTFTFRVNNTSVIPPLYPDPQLTETTPFSNESQPVKIDRTGPNAPLLSVRQPDYDGDGGWWKGSATVSFVDQLDRDLADGSAGSGVDQATIPAERTYGPGVRTVSETVKDRVGNESAPATRTIQVDGDRPNAPTVSVRDPEFRGDGGWWKGSVTATFAAAGDPAPSSGIDAGSLRGPETRDVAGPYTFSATVKDNVGYESDPGTRAVQVDTAAPAAPSILTSRDPEDEAGGWFRNSVGVSYAANGDPSPGSGVRTSSLPAGETLAGTGTYPRTATVTDNVGYESEQASRTIRVDATKPTVSASCPAEVLIGTPNVAATVTAGDGDSGLAGTSGSRTIDTSSVGLRTVRIVATDKVGLTNEATCSTRVVYLYGGLQQPVNADGSSVFKLGSTVPLKFRLTDYNAAAVGPSDARLELTQVSGAVTGTVVEDTYNLPPSTGSAFRYDPASGQYQLNLGTKGLRVGTYELRVRLDDGKAYRTTISLR